MIRMCNSDAKYTHAAREKEHDFYSNLKAAVDDLAVSRRPGPVTVPGPERTVLVLTLTAAGQGSERQGWQGRGGSPTRAPRPATPGEISDPRPATPSDPGRPARPGHLSKALPGPDICHRGFIFIL